MPIRSVNDKLIHLHETTEQIKGPFNQPCQAERDRSNTQRWVVLFKYTALEKNTS